MLFQVWNLDQRFRYPATMVAIRQALEWTSNGGAVARCLEYLEKKDLVEPSPIDADSWQLTSLGFAWLGEEPRSGVRASGAAGR